MRLVVLAALLAYVITIVVSLFSYVIGYEAGPMDLPKSIHIAKGFPVPIEVSHNGFKENINLPLGLLFSFTFWFLTIISFSYLVKKGIQKRTNLWLLLLVLAIGRILMQIFMSDSSCLKGYPIPYKSDCLDVFAPNQPYVLFDFINYIFWLGISCFILFALIQLQKINFLNPIKNILYTLIFTLLSLIIKTECGGFFCIFPSGRGFIFPYIDNGHLEFGYFVIDYFFFMILYFVYKLFMNIYNNKVSKNLNQNSSKLK